MSHSPIQRSITPPSDQDTFSLGGARYHDAYLNRCEEQLNDYAKNFDLGDPKDRCKAAYREQKGEIVSVKPDGTPHDHVKKVQQDQRGLKKHCARLQDLLKDPQVSREQKMRAQRLLT